MTQQKKEYDARRQKRREYDATTKRNITHKDLGAVFLHISPPGVSTLAEK